ncbi:hypothetical protein CN918_32495 [Priestia megaterium]|nr:hypothetical protein CN918_32495 [Priestia megaterium]
MEEIFFLMVTFGFIVSTRGLTQVLFGKRTKEKQEKHHMREIQDFITDLKETNILPVLKEQNITHFIAEEGRFRLDISYNQQDIFANLKADTYHDGFYETIYAFKYDEKTDKLISTSRNEDVYTKEMYDELNPFLAKLTEKISNINWNQKEREVIHKPSHPLEKEENYSEFTILQEKAAQIIKNQEYLTEDELKKANYSIKHELEKTFLFYQALNDSEKEKYEPVITDKLKEIEITLESLLETIEETKYIQFKAKLKNIVLDDEE